MTKRALTIFSVPALFAGLLAAVPAAAQTQCRPGDLFCAELQIGPGRAGVRIGGGAQEVPPPPPPVVVQPPTVYVEPAPPPPPTVYVQPPPPPPQTVYVQPPPPPPPPQMVYVQPAQPMPLQRVHEDRYPHSSTGLHLHVSGLFGEHTAMGGIGGALRLRPIPHLAVDLGAGVYGGVDYNGLDRVEVPVQANLLVFFNPRHRFQFYALAGVGASIGHAEGFNRFAGGFDQRDYLHVGGELGLGVEWRISRVFAMNLDVRGFIRQRVDSNALPEFEEGLRSTDTSGGVLGRVGMTFYFGH